MISDLCSYKNCVQDLPDSPDDKIKIILLFQSQQTTVNPSPGRACFEGSLEHFCQRPISWAARCCSAQAGGNSGGTLCSHSCSESSHQPNIWHLRTTPHAALPLCGGARGRGQGTSSGPSHRGHSLPSMALTGDPEGLDSSPLRVTPPCCKPCWKLAKEQVRNLDLIAPCHSSTVGRDRSIAAKPKTFPCKASRRGGNFGLL